MFQSNFHLNFDLSLLSFAGKWNLLGNSDSSNKMCIHTNILMAWFKRLYNNEVTLWFRAIQSWSTFLIHLKCLHFSTVYSGGLVKLLCGYSRDTSGLPQSYPYSNLLSDDIVVHCENLGLYVHSIIWWRQKTHKPKEWHLVPSYLHNIDFSLYLLWH